MDLTDDMEEETGAREEPQENKKEIDFYPSIVQFLSEDDLKSPAVLKMVISQNKKYGQELERLKEFENNFYKCDKDLAVANEKLKKKKSLEIFTDIVYTIGGVLIALSTLDFTKDFSVNHGLFIVIGIVLIVGSAIAKWSRI
ncbi:MAG: hypothetical protein J5798_07860 [Spirochaetaceae bacterium]|nr:hypothetical protein [Spirochaetaceae bacterium]